MSIQFSYATFLTSLMVCLIISICSVVYMKSKKRLFSKFEVLCLIACFGALNIRLVLPFEYPFTYSVYIPNIYFEVCVFIRKDFWRNVSIFDVFIVITLIGAILIGCYKIILYCQFCRLMRDSEYVKTITLDNGKKIPILKNKMVYEPFIVGIQHTKIILPEKVPYDISYVIQHELQHYKNHDLWLKVFFEGVVTLYWWNPFAYVIRKYMYNMLELRNDFEITEKSNEEEKINYANTLVEAAKFKQKIRYGIGISSNESFLKYRIYSICEHRANKRSVFIILLTIFTIISSFLVFEPISKEMPGGTFSIKQNELYIIHNQQGYHIIVDGQDVGVVDEVPDSFKNIKIINDIEDGVVEKKFE